MLLNTYNWLRIFDGTAFYIVLLSETIKDIRYFLALYILSLFIFGLPLELLNNNSWEGKEIVESYTDNMLMNVIINRYLMTLGEFSLDSFAEHPQSGLCYLFFIFAAFISGVTMLSMLVALMSDSFGRVMENKQLNSTRMKLTLMGE